MFDDSRYKSHLVFDVLVSSSSQEILYKQDKIRDISDNWSNYYQSYVYALLKPQASSEQMQRALESLAADKYANNEALQGSQFIAQPLADITPGPKLGNSPTIRLPLFVYYILAALALVIMISACLNYTNLSIARALTRAKEIGVRKVNGAKRKDLILQFLSEAIITVLLALLFAFVFLFFVKSAFLKLWVNQYLNLDLNITSEVVLLSFGFALLVGIIAGIFPALHLSGYNPTRALKSLKLGQPGRLGLRKVLTTVQFGLSLLFIITAIVVFNQFRHFMQFEYGFNPENVLLVNLQSNDYELAKTALSGVPGVDDVAGCAYLPATGRNDNTRLMKPGSPPEEEGYETINVGVDESFIRTLEINLVAGQNLPPAGSGSSSMILVNEATANVLGYDNPLDIVGESLKTSSDTLQVAGVVENFTFHILFNGRPIGPVMMRYVPETFKFLSIKVGSGQEQETLARLEQAWKTIDPIHPLAYEFYEDKLANYNRGVFDIASVVGFIALLAITIACLGLLGMATYTTERRTKEVGIRKVLGASNFRLAYLLSKEFLIILGVAIVIATPLSYFINNLWLDFLVTRVEFGPETLLIGSLLLLL
ncbi:MAG: FtsX-like permease family protein, partial [Tunicatimonas sp.]|uniref:FtsX-like permease family protein n=1 Tax=Tunicatimonas sp. TaxID=1940096 RepID=UPI003C70EA31